MIAGALEVAVTTNVWSSFGAPEPIPLRLTVRDPESSAITTSPNGSSVGGSFTGLTVRVKVRVVILLEAPPSLTFTVMSALPDALLAGVKLRVAVGSGLL